MALDAEGELDQSTSRMVRSEVDCAGDAIELGGSRLPSASSDSLEPFQDKVVSRVSFESCDD